MNSRDARRAPHLRSKSKWGPVGLAFPLLAVAIVVAVIALVLVDDGIGSNAAGLPVQFRISQLALSDLPVEISNVESCSCWDGPRSQAQRKFKFHIINRSNRLLNIGGGQESSIRLIVAYPGSKQPALTFPQADGGDSMGQLGSPADTLTEIATHVTAQKASRIFGANATFAVPSSYSIWALPPTPNRLAERVGVGDRSFTYPTVVDKTTLLPGEGYQGDRLGHGVWTFYVPLNPKFAELFKGDVQLVLTPDQYENEVIFVGIAALEVAGSDVRMLGFAPAPSQDALAAPSDL